MRNRGVRIARLPDHQALFGAFLLLEFTSENIQREIDWLAPHFASADGRIGLSFRSLLAESAGLRIVIDTSSLASRRVQSQQPEAARPNVLDHKEVKSNAHLRFVEPLYGARHA
jgi:hypothetical protein